MSAYTSGPWTCHEDDCEGHEGRWIVTTTAGIFVAENLDEANAHLIAASPMLLKALKMLPCPKCVADEHEGAGCYRQEAIQAAEGRT